MSESEETKRRLGVKPEEAEEGAVELPTKEDEKKEELQQTIQTKAEEIGRGEGEGGFVAEPAEEEPLTEAPKKMEQKVKVKAKGPSLKKREPDSSKNMANISKQVERQANQLIKIEKIIVSLQKSVDKQSNTIKQLYGVVTQLQRQVRSSKNQKQNQGTQKKMVGKIDRLKKRHLKGRR